MTETDMSITIGRVEKVSFGDKLNDPSVHVGLLINEDFLERLRTDSVVTIETQGLLGDRFINISTGKDQQLLPPGSYLKSEDSGDERTLPNTVCVAREDVKQENCIGDVQEEVGEMVAGRRQAIQLIIQHV